MQDALKEGGRVTCSPKHYYKGAVSGSDWIHAHMNKQNNGKEREPSSRFTHRWAHMIFGKGGTQSSEERKEILEKIVLRKHDSHVTQWKNSTGKGIIWPCVMDQIHCFQVGQSGE